jgi:hypothetical protein
MKRYVLAIALTGLMSVTVLAGEIPTNGSPAPAPTTSTTLTNVVLTIITLIGH